MLSFRGKDLGFSEHIMFWKEYHVNVGWECVNCFASLGYTLYTHAQTHPHVHTKNGQFVDSGLGCILQILGFNDHKPEQIPNMTRDSNT